MVTTLSQGKQRSREVGGECVMSEAWIVGENAFARACFAHVCSREQITVPGITVQDQVRRLCEREAPSGAMVCACASGEWEKVRAHGWHVYWCGPGACPAGCDALPDMVQSWTVDFFVHTVWGRVATDQAETVMTVREAVNEFRLALHRVCLVAHTSGGVGASRVAREICQCASTLVSSVLLWDMTSTGSQESFLMDRKVLPENCRSCALWRPHHDIHEGMTCGTVSRLSFDVSCSPFTTDLSSVSLLSLCQQFGEAVRDQYDLTVIDTDRLTRSACENPLSLWSSVWMPWHQSGDYLLYLCAASRLSLMDSWRTLQHTLQVSNASHVGFLCHDDPSSACQHVDDEGWETYGTWLGTLSQPLTTSMPLWGSLAHHLFPGIPLSQSCERSQQRHRHAHRHHGSHS